jgi:hypothetical protein
MTEDEAETVAALAAQCVWGRKPDLPGDGEGPGERPSRSCMLLTY